MDTIVLAWPKTFINNSVPITLGTSLDSCGMGNFIPGLFKTAYIISCTGRDFKMQSVRIFSCRQFCPDVWAEVPSLRFQGKVDGKLEYAWWLSFVYAYAFRVGGGWRSWHSKTLSLPLRKSHRRSSPCCGETKQLWAIWAAQKLRPPVLLAHHLLCSNISFFRDATFASLGRQS